MNQSRKRKIVWCVLAHSTMQMEIVERMMVYLSILVLTGHPVDSIGWTELLIGALILVFTDMFLIWRFRQILHNKRFDSRFGIVDRYANPLRYNLSMFVSIAAFAVLALGTVIVGFLLVTKFLAT